MSTVTTRPVSDRTVSTLAARAIGAMRTSHVTIGAFVHAVSEHPAYGGKDATGLRIPVTPEHAADMAEMSHPVGLISEKDKAYAVVRTARDLACLLGTGTKSASPGSVTRWGRVGAAAAVGYVDTVGMAILAQYGADKAVGEMVAAYVESKDGDALNVALRAHKASQKKSGTTVTPDASPAGTDATPEDTDAGDRGPASVVVGGNSESEDNLLATLEAIALRLTADGVSAANGERFAAVLDTFGSVTVRKGKRAPKVAPVAVAVAS